MRQLTHEYFERAHQFLIRYARPLERQLFMHQFESSSMTGVLLALKGYQNPDGGFGRALEPDLRSPSSSALATAIALRALGKLGCPADEPMVKHAVAYLEATFEQKGRTWRIAPSDVNSYPHAPWWHDEDGSLERTFDGFQVIPRALILACLYHYSSLVPEVWLEKLAEETIERIESDPEFGGGGGSDLEYAIDLANARGLPRPWARRLVSRIREVVPRAVVGDSGKWNTYCLTPLRLIRTPETIGADLVADLVQEHLDYQIDHQSPEGTWDPVWSWGGSYPKDWENARMEWRGHLTLESLTTIKAFGRMED